MRRQGNGVRMREEAGHERETYRERSRKYSDRTEICVHMYMNYKSDNILV